MSLTRMERETIIAQSPAGRGPAVPNRLKSEQGMALIIALVLLVLLTILGIWVLNSASTDLRIAGNYRNNQNAFFTAEAENAYATNSAMLTQAFTSMSGTTLYSVPALPAPLASSATGTIEYLGSGPLPAGSIYDADVDYSGNPKFYGLFFSAKVIGTGMNNAQALVESGVMQVVAH
jgi:hypothetical protein